MEHDGKANGISTLLVRIGAPSVPNFRLSICGAGGTRRLSRHTCTKRFWLILLLTFVPAAVSRADSPTYARDIAPLIDTNCVSCHRTGEVAPFPLQTFEQVKKRAGMITHVTADRYMPPWKPQPGWGQFADQRRLSDAQITLLADWFKAGSPQGDPKDRSPAPTFNDGWKLGNPDVVVKMPEPFQLKADGAGNFHDVYRAFVIPLDVPETRYVSAVEFKPDNRKIVHHALFFLDNTGAAAKKQAASNDGQPGFETFGGPGFAPTGGLGGWAPGATPEPLPDGWGRVLRKGSDLVMQIHFHPDGKEESEQASLGIYFTKEKPQRIVAGANAHTFRISIPPNDSDYVVTATYTAPIDLLMTGITPHAHLICKDMKAIATLPDKTTVPLIWIKDWDFNWQGQYRYVKPVKLPAGTVVKMTYTMTTARPTSATRARRRNGCISASRRSTKWHSSSWKSRRANPADWPKFLQGRRRLQRLGATG